MNKELESFTKTGAGQFEKNPFEETVNATFGHGALSAVEHQSSKLSGPTLEFDTASLYTAQELAGKTVSKDKSEKIESSDGAARENVSAQGRTGDDLENEPAYGHGGDDFEKGGQRRDDSVPIPVDNQILGNADLLKVIQAVLGRERFPGRQEAQLSFAPETLSRDSARYIGSQLAREIVSGTSFGSPETQQLIQSVIKRIQLADGAEGLRQFAQNLSNELQNNWNIRTPCPTFSIEVSPTRVDLHMSNHSTINNRLTTLLPNSRQR